MSRITIKEFVEEKIDCYIFGDLQTLASLPEKSCGSCTDPMMLTILSAMELIGGLMCDCSKPCQKQKAFNHFWSHLCELNDNYDKIDNLKEIFYQCIRHGIAHYNLPKAGVSIARNGSQHLHLTDEQNLNVNVIILYRDIKKVYTKIKPSILKNDKSERNLNNLIKNLERSNSNLTKAVRSKIPFSSTAAGTHASLMMNLEISSIDKN